MITSDDEAFYVDQAGTNQFAVWAHRQHDRARCVIDRDPGRARPLVDGVAVVVVDELAAAINENSIFAKAERSNNGGVFVDPAEDYAGPARSYEFFLGFGSKAD